MEGTTARRARRARHLADSNYTVYRKETNIIDKRIPTIETHKSGRKLLICKHMIRSKQEDSKLFE